MKRTKLLFVLVPLLAWMAFIFGTSCTVIRPEEFFYLVSSSTGADRESMKTFAVFWGISWFAIVKGWHFTEFAILTVLTSATIGWFDGKSSARPIYLAMLICIAFAASDEWHQSFVPDRFVTVQDVLIGAVLLVRMNRKNGTKNKLQ